jgi:hypothetical protein
MSQFTTSLNDLLKKDVAEIREWIQTVRAQQNEASHDFNWLGLAESASFNASSEHTSTVALLWAEVALEAYDWLAKNSEPDTCVSFTNASTLLRAAMIARYGSEAGHTVLDMDTIVSNFFTDLPLSYEEAEEKARNWKVIEIDEIRKLRKIKNRLKAMELLAEHNTIRADQTLCRWLTLRKKLP